MPWCFPWPDYIKKKACRYLLQHYVGNFLEEKLTLDQLSVDLYSGTGTVKDVKLDVWNLNEVLESVGAPVEIRDGCVSSISVEIPWSSLLTANSKVEIKGLEITVQPKYRLESPGSSGSMGDSMWSSMSMSSSMQLAQECLKQDTEGGGESSETSSNVPFEGPELLAQTIESVLTRVEVTLIDTLVRLEHVPQGSNSGVALEVHIERLRFFDEVARDTLMDLGSSVDRDQLHNFVPAAIAHKNLQMMGVSIHCEEFPEEQRLSASTSPESDRWGKEGGNAFDKMASSPDMPPQHHEVGGKKSPKVLTGGGQELLESCIIGECSGKQEIKLKIKQNEQISGPKAEIDTYLGSINLFFSPRQVHLLLELVNGFLSPATSDTASVRGKQPNKPMQAEDYQRIESDLQERFLQQQRQEDLLRRQSWGLQSEDEDFLEPSLVQSIDDSDMFFSMSGSMMSMSAPGHFSDDMESSISSTLSTCSTDTSRTGSSIGRLGYGNPYYRRPDSSPFASTIPKGTTKKSRSKRGLSDHLDDTTAEATRYKLRFSSLSLTILHEDPPHMPLIASTETTNGNTFLKSQPRTTAAPLGKSASQMLQERAENFFFVLGRQAYGMKNQAEWKDRFARACPYDHLRFVAAPVTLECERKQNNAVTFVTMDLSLGTLELLECLFDRHNSELLMSVAGTPDPRPPTPDHIEILSFAEERSGSINETTKSCIHVRLKHMEKTFTQSNHRRSLSKPKTDLSVELGALRCEVDISIVDRLYALLHPQPVGQYRDNSNGRYTSLSANGGMQNKQALFTETLEETSTASNHLLTINVSCAKAHMAFRFPIPDLRDMNNVAWWKRSLRDEILYVELQETYFKTRYGDESSHQTMLLECKELHGFLQLSPESAPVSFMRINPAQVDCTSEDRRFYWPRMVVKIFPASQTSVLEEESELGDTMNNTPQNSWEEICQFAEAEPSPFSSKKVMYESEQMVMPGDHEEMKEFMKHCISDARVTLDITLPRVNIQLPSKEFMETLYNRFGNDLLLWQPAAPTPRDHQDSYLSYAGIDGGLDMTQLLNIGNGEKFTMCRSAAAAALDSDSDEEDDSGRFLTTGDRDELNWRRRNAQQKASSLQSMLALTLNIGHGKMTVWSPNKDCDGSISTSLHGETLIEIEDGQLFTVSEYKGDPHLSHLCIQANRFAMYHNGEVEMPMQVEPIPPANWKHADHLQCCVYMSDDGGHTKSSGSMGKEENSKKMFALAMKMQYQPLKNVKTIECAIGIRGTTIQHYSSKPEHSWMVQLGEFFDVIDETILGYDMPRVVTELHAHFWDCGIDYRPKYLPFRTFLGIETLSISSNLVYESKESLLRFLIDDAALYLSDKCNEKKVDLCRNYVCVVDIGLLELAMRLSTDKNKNPKMDLKVSNNVVHIRTCADACSALTKLLLYLANDGDMRGPPQDTEEQPEDLPQVHFTEPVSMPSNPSAPVKANQPTADSPVRQGHIDQMHQLMEEAMKELNCSKSPSDTDFDDDDEDILRLPCTLKQSPNSEVFLFPDEDDKDDDTFHNVDRPRPTPPMPAPVEQTFQQLDSHHFDGEVEEDDEGSDFFNDDDFCVLDDPGMGVLPKDGQPEVKCLDENPILIKEDHFNKPLGRGDQLNAPADFPVPIMKYTLQEMTLVWHIYGGNDLGTAKVKVKKPESRTSSPAHVTVGIADKTSHGSPQSSPSSKKIPYRPVNPKQLSHKERGGPGRDHSVLMELQLNKVRFRHEVYPDDTRESSRQILVISDIEIRDKLAQSNINKFLYLYSSEARPKRTHANMVLVKALHIRPDPNLSAEECCLRVSLQPLRLNIDQDALFFVRDFFTDVSNEATKMPMYPESRRGSINLTPTPSSTSISSQQTLSPQHQSIATTQTSIATTRHSLQFEDDSTVSAAEMNFDPMSTCTLQADSVQYSSTAPSIQSNDSIGSSFAANTTPVFFRSFVFSPDVPIKLDYEGKRVDMEQGTLIGLLVGLGQLNKSELTLKRLLNRHGLLGLDKLLVYVVNEWAQDIKKRQLPSILGGVGPMHSLVQLVQGTVDLFRLPIEQYQKDGRLMRGFQRGANSFGTSTAMACVELTNRMVRVMQTAAETAYDMVSPGPSVTQRAITYGPFGQQRLARQPTDFREGMANAITVVREGLGDTANAMMQVAVEEHEHKGYSGAVGGILRQIPPSVIKPLILATEATSSVLGGMRNQMLPDARKEDSDKWKSEDR